MTERLDEVPTYELDRRDNRFRESNTLKVTLEALAPHCDLFGLDAKSGETLRGLAPLFSDSFIDPVRDPAGAGDLLTSLVELMRTRHLDPGAPRRPTWLVIEE